MKMVRPMVKHALHQVGEPLAGDVIANEDES